MKTINLPDRLKRLSKELKQNAELLQGTDFIRASSEFSKALRRFETAVENLVDAGDLDLPLLKELLASPAAKKHLDEAALLKLHKAVTGKGASLPKEATRKQLKAHFLQEVVQGRYSAKAIAALRKCFAEAAAPARSATGEAALLQDLHRIGGLTELELAEEKKALLRKPARIEDLARTARLRIPASATPARRFDLVVKFARRARANLD